MRVAHKGFVHSSIKDSVLVIFVIAATENYYHDFNCLAIMIARQYCQNRCSGERDSGERQTGR